MSRADAQGATADGVAEQLPGQMAFPGWEPDPGPACGASPGDGQPVLPGMDDASLARPAAEPDAELDRVATALRAADPDFSGIATAIRSAFDLLLDGQHTGRYRWDQLHKTEKTHAGTLVEIGIQRRLGLADGAALDYSIAGVEVDCKFSHRSGGWMIPPEAADQLMLLVHASDDEGTWSAGLLRARQSCLREAGNRDLKRALNDGGRATIRWLVRGAALPENVLLRLAERDTAAIFGCPPGQRRVNELFRRALGRRVSRAVVATVAMQDDYMKRVRAGGGARDQLRDEGIVIFGDYAGHQALAAALGLPVPGPGEFVSARLARCGTASDGPAPDADASGGGAGRAAGGRYVRLGGADWALAVEAAVEVAVEVAPAPRLPRV
ncbi:MAG TPA: NaeI family type II restriction endonuclease [Streptosporangiaceae bacterium]